MIQKNNAFNVINFVFLLCLFLDYLYDALKEYDERRDECFDLVMENDRLSERIIYLETKVDTLMDNDSTLERRIDYWRSMYRSLCKQHKKLLKLHKNCPKKSIILYR